MFSGLRHRRVDLHICHSGIFDSEIQTDRKFEFSFQRLLNLAYFTAVGPSQAHQPFFLTRFHPKYSQPSKYRRYDFNSCHFIDILTLDNNKKH